MDAPTRPLSPLWRQDSSRKLVHGALTGATLGAIYATARALPAASVLRASIFCGAVATPFFTIRDALSSGIGVDGPVASAIAGGFSGYVGSFFVAGPQWKTVSHGAMAVGIGCGLLDVVISGLDWRRKLMIVNRHDDAIAAASHAADNKHPDSDSVLSSAARSQSSWFKWPPWFPVLKDIDEEYQDLLRRQEATVLALEEEQARIAALLEALESLKASNHVRDTEIAECESQSAHPSSSSSSMRTSSSKSGP